MLDLTNFILNSSSTTESSINTRDFLESEQPLDLTDESLDKDSFILNPSSFVLLLAGILANTPVKNAISSDSSTPVPGSSTDAYQGAKEAPKKSDPIRNAQDLLRIENQLSTTGVLLSSSDNSDVTIEDQVVTTEPQKSSRSFLFNDTSVNTGSSSEQLPVHALENNVAMAWINSDNFEPPLSIAVTHESAEEFVPDLDPFLAESKELREIVTKKDEDLQKNSVLDAINDKSSIKSRKSWSNIAQLTTTLSTINSDSTSLNQEPKIDSLTSHNIQHVMQPIGSPNKDQISANIPEAKSLSIPIELHNSQWANKFSEHILWLGHQGIKSALIKIHPEDLGPLEISIKVVKDSASVSINTHNNYVRDIVDQALPKLREMMSEQGLNLSDVHVGSDANSRQFSNNNAPAEEGLIISPDDETQLTTLNKRGQQGLIDDFA
ncbi:flagellar hook-length control protein FliK [Legionella antarctica]|uniref:Flagellar hook-length control protein FliK n=1 Tax=Legionella antarctica TaxID=2708020 RepID=A0A6F8T5L7_9GAMM|nr:flagellar hook-length control protein FliK [Legionella antarctica]BCA95440.1 flagellar hook-length control protein FliK [Legionella antarctica]